MALVNSLRQNYSFSAMKGVDWQELSARYRHEAQASATPAEFVAAIRGMLAELRDLHVWIEIPDGPTVHPYVSRYRGNFDHDDLKKTLQAVQPFPPLGFIGRTEHGFGVMVIQQLPPANEFVYSRWIDAVRSMSDAPGWLVDLRANSGGAEPGAAQIARLFNDQRRLYARSKVRSGPARDAFRETPARYLEPSSGDAILCPVICLIGPGCVSSGEGFALMMKALDHVTLVGQATRGASGNPQPETLSNGVIVWFSRWISLQPDGTPIEGRGVPADIVLDHNGPGDSTFRQAVGILQKQVARHRAPQ